MLDHADDDHEEVRGDEEQEDRNQDLDALLDAAQVQEDQDAEDQHLERRNGSPVQLTGRKLKIWSTPEATEVEIVRT